MSLIVFDKPAMVQFQNQLESVLNEQLAAAQETKAQLQVALEAAQQELESAEQELESAERELEAAQAAMEAALAMPECDGDDDDSGSGGRGGRSSGGSGGGRSAAIQAAAERISAATERISAAQARIAQAQADIAALTNDIAIVGNAIELIGKGIQQSKEFMTALMDLIVEIDGAFFINMQGAHGAILDFINNMLSIKESFGFEVSLSSEMINALKQTNSPMFVLGFMSAMLSAAAGKVSCMVFGADPINLVTGNFIYDKEDIEVPGRFPLMFKRFYNAIGGSDGVLGKNWTHNFNIHLTEKEDAISIAFDDGHVETYKKLEDGSYSAPEDRNNTLEKSKEGYLLTLPSIEMYHFNGKGQLEYIADLNDNRTQFRYEDGLLMKVKTTSGSLLFTYDENRRIIEVKDHSGRKVSFGYADGQLVTVIHPTSAVFGYAYNENGILDKIINPIGIAPIRNEYDDRDRAVKQYFADGGVYSIDYDDEKMETRVTEQNGNKIKYLRDEKYRTTGIVYDDSQEKFEYNDNNKRTKYIDRNGNERGYTYDERGNLTSEIDPLGCVTAIDYNDLNKPIKIFLPNGGVTELEYDTKGNILKVADTLKRELNFTNSSKGQVELVVLPDGSENAVKYDERGNIIAITDGAGAITRYEYDSLNCVVKTTNGEGHVTIFTYTAKGDIESVTNAEGKVRHYEYNLSGKVTKITDFNGSIIEYKYNKLGKIEEVIDQADGSTKLKYDLMWNVSSVTNPLGHMVKYVYDNRQRVIQIVDEEGNATSYEHDSKGNVTAVVSPISGRTEIIYDALDRQAKILEPDGAITLHEYDSIGNIVAVTDVLGNVTKREYDLAGQMIKLTDPLGNETEFTYTSLGQIESVTDPSGNQTTYSYYHGGKVKSVTLPSGESESYEYDKNGNRISITDALGARTELKYDQLDRVVETVDPLGHSKKFSYDALGNITGITDENGNLTQYKYSALGDVIEVIDASGHSTKYGYDAARRLTKLEQFRMIDGIVAGIKIPEYQITTYKRNKKGEVIEVKSPLGTIVKFGYNAIGNLTSKLDEDGLETLYEYDLASKLTKISYADGKTVEFGYNALKQLTEMKDWLGTTKIEVDPLGRATKVSDPQNNEVAYKWNALGQKEALTYPDGSEVSYEYDISGRMQKVNSMQGVTSYTYDRMGRLSERILPDSTHTKFEVNPLGRLTGLTHSKNGDILDQFKYSYDPTGNITGINKLRVGVEADSGLFSYGYDLLGRLVSAQGCGVEKLYSYDSLGNRVSAVENGVETRHSYNARNQLICTVAPEVETSYSYDERGNLRKVAQNGSVVSKYTFDATNMMTSAFSTTKGNAEYTYNGFRNRVAKLENLSGIGNIPDPIREVTYTLDMTLPYDNLLTTQATQSQNFVWGNGLISASGEDSFYYLQDHLGSPIRLIGDSGFDEVLTYDEFGKQTSGTPGKLRNPFTFTGEHQSLSGGFSDSSQPFGFTGEHQSLSGGFSNSSQPFGFTGYMHDSVSGLLFAQARYYDPRTSRMISQDPHWGPQNMIFGDSRNNPIPDISAIRQSGNLYSYAMNNPLTYIDRTGLCAEGNTGQVDPSPGDIMSWLFSGLDLSAQSFFQWYTNSFRNFFSGNPRALQRELDMILRHSRIASRVTGGLQALLVPFIVGMNAHQNHQSGATRDYIVNEMAADTLQYGLVAILSGLAGAGASVFLTPVGGVVVAGLTAEALHSLNWDGFREAMHHPPEIPSQWLDADGNINVWMFT